MLGMHYRKKNSLNSDGLAAMIILKVYNGALGSKEPI